MEDIARDVLDCYIKNTKDYEKIFCSLIKNIYYNDMCDIKNIFYVTKRFLENYNLNPEPDATKINIMNDLLDTISNSEEQFNIDNNIYSLRDLYKYIINSKFLSSCLTENNKINIMSFKNLGSIERIIMVQNGYLDNFDIDKLKNNKLNWLLTIADLCIYSNYDEKYVEILKRSLSSNYITRESHDLLYFYNFIQNKKLEIDISKLFNDKFIENISFQKNSSDAIFNIINNYDKNEKIAVKIVNILKNPDFYKNTTKQTLNVIISACLKLFEQGKTRLARDIIDNYIKCGIVKFDARFFKKSEVETMFKLLFNREHLNEKDIETFKMFFENFKLKKDFVFRIVILNDYDFSYNSAKKTFKNILSIPYLNIDEIIERFNKLDEYGKNIFLESILELQIEINNKENSNNTNLINRRLMTIGLNVCSKNYDSIAKQLAKKFALLNDKNTFLNNLAEFKVAAEIDDKIEPDEKNSINENLDNIFNEIFNHYTEIGHSEEGQEYYDMFYDNVNYYKFLNGSEEKRGENHLSQNLVNRKQKANALYQNLSYLTNKEINPQNALTGLRFF